MLALAGFWLLFTTFMVYDDEGYVLISLRDFSLHGGLYDQVYSQYGPFPYLLYDGLHRVFHFAFTNTTGRWITWVNWLGTAGVCAMLVGRRTRSALWTGFTLAGVFTYLWPMINEPIHPGGLIALMVAIGAWLGSELWESGRIRGFALLSAIIGTALALTKINVGIFFLGSAFTWLALNSKMPATRTLTWLVALGCAVLPFVLMRTLFGAPWVRLFALLFTGSALSVLLVARTTARPLVTASTWAWFAGVILVTGTIICGLVLVRGTTAYGLVDGVLLEPFKHPNVYFFPMRWRIGTGVLALVSLIIAAWTVRRGWLGSERCRQLVAVGLFIAGAIFMCSPLEIIPTSLAAWGMCYGVTLAWLALVPLQPNDPGAGTRAWVALLLVFQFLHAYPIAGSQINWGTYLWVPLLSLGLHNAWPVLADLFGSWRRPMQIAGVVMVAGVTLVVTGGLAKIGWDRYPTSQPLNLPGAENIRATDDTTYDLRIMVENARAHADLLFSYPGIYSANLWTGLPTPTLANATHWFSLLTPERQQAIIARMARAPQAVLIVQRDSLNYLAKAGFHPRGPLIDWLMTNFECAFSVDNYEFWVHRGRKITGLSTATFNFETPGRGELTVTLAALPRPVASIEVCDVGARHLPLIELNASNASASFQTVNLSGQTTGPILPAVFPVQLPGLGRLMFNFVDDGTRIKHAHALIVLRDAEGRVLAEAREID